MSLPFFAGQDNTIRIPYVADDSSTAIQQYIQYSSVEFPNSSSLEDELIRHLQLVQICQPLDTALQPAEFLENQHSPTMTRNSYASFSDYGHSFLQGQSLPACDGLDDGSIPGNVQNARAVNDDAGFPMCNDMQSIDSLSQNDFDAFVVSINDDDNSGSSNAPSAGYSDLSSAPGIDQSVTEGTVANMPDNVDPNILPPSNIHEAVQEQTHRKHTPTDLQRVMEPAFGFEMLVNYEGITFNEIDSEYIQRLRKAMSELLLNVVIDNISKLGSGKEGPFTHDNELSTEIKVICQFPFLVSDEDLVRLDIANPRLHHIALRLMAQRIIDVQEPKGYLRVVFFVEAMACEGATIPMRDPLTGCNVEQDFQVDVAILYQCPPNEQQPDFETAILSEAEKEQWRLDHPMCDRMEEMTWQDTQEILQYAALIHFDSIGASKANELKNIGRPGILREAYHFQIHTKSVGDYGIPRMSTLTSSYH